MAFLLEHPYTYLKCNKQYQNQQFTLLNQTTSGFLDYRNYIFFLPTVFFCPRRQFLKTLSQERRKNAKKTTIPLIELTHNFQKPPISRKKILASPISFHHHLYFSIRWKFFFISLIPGALYIRGGSNSLPFYILLFLPEKIPFSYTFHLD